MGKCVLFTHDVLLIGSERGIRLLFSSWSGVQAHVPDRCTTPPVSKCLQGNRMNQWTRPKIVNVFGTGITLLSSCVGDPQQKSLADYSQATLSTDQKLWRNHTMRNELLQRTKHEWKHITHAQMRGRIVSC